MKIFNLLSILLFSLLIISCSDDDEPKDNNNNNQTDYSLGWFGEDKLDEVPVSVTSSFGNSNLPVAYDITDKFPPIGNQENYGTCVAWSVAYNTKTAISGMDRGLTPSQLADPSNQFSPKDLFTALPDNLKGQNCDGTNFGFALDLLRDRGVATMASVPYTNLGNCFSGSTDPSWTAEAANNKIQYWRKVDGNVNAIKKNIADNIPVILGAKLADNFMSWGSENVLTSHSSFTNVGIHSYHAMVISGYDDSKGPNGAFRVINSWGTDWGDSGYIWIDYNFLIDEFGVSSTGENSLFIAANQEGDNVTPPDDNDPSPNTNGVDLASWVFGDYSTYDQSGYWNERELQFNIYNIGNSDAKPVDNWAVYYIYFNAYDANDYGFLFYDEFNTTIASETWECPTADNCIINTAIEGGNSFATKVFGTEQIVRTYYVPEISGEYYLLMIADGDDVYQELDEVNNFYYTSIDPLYFDSGYALKGDDSGNNFEVRSADVAPVLSDSKMSSAQAGKMKNAYTNAEIAAVLKRDKASGRFHEKLNNFQSTIKENRMYKNPK